MGLQIYTKVLNSYSLLFKFIHKMIKLLTYMKHVLPIFLNPGGGPVFLDTLLVIDAVDDCIEKLL